MCIKIAKQQFEKIKHVFPKTRGGVQIDHFTMINILLYVVENGCKWRDIGDTMVIRVDNAMWVGNAVAQYRLGMPYGLVMRP